LRSRIVLACAQGLDNKQVAAKLGVVPATVGKWRRRFVERRLDGLLDEHRPGGPSTISDEQIEGGDCGHTGADAEERDALVAGINGRRNRPVALHHRPGLAFNLNPHLVDTVKLKQPRGYKTTPAMAAGVVGHVWAVREIAALLG
jgi:transposase-like protein